MGMIGGPCCQKCSNIHIVTDDGQILYRRHFFFDSPSTVPGAKESGVNGVGRDDNGNFFGSASRPNKLLVTDITKPQTEELWVVRAWDENGDKSWDWNQYPLGHQVNMLFVGQPNQPFRGTLVVSNAMMAPDGTVLVSATDPQGQNWVTEPVWQGFTFDDRMYGVKDGVTLWDFRVKDQIGPPYSLGLDATPPNPGVAAPFFWHFYGGVRVSSVGGAKTIWRAAVTLNMGYRTITDDRGHQELIIGGSYSYDLFWQVNNADGTVDWHFDWRPVNYSYNFQGGSIRPSNIPSFIGVPNGPYFQVSRIPQMCLGPGDLVYCCMRGGEWGVPSEVTIWRQAGGQANLDNPYKHTVFSNVCKIDMSSGSPNPGASIFGVSRHIATPRSMCVSQDGTKLAVLGIWMQGEDLDGWKQSYWDSTIGQYVNGQVPNVYQDYVLEIFSTADMELWGYIRLGGNLSGRLQYLDDGHVAIDDAIYLIDGAPIDRKLKLKKWRRWLSPQFNGGFEQLDSFSAWGSFAAGCPAVLVAEEGDVPGTW